MAFSSGTFTLVSGNPVVTGTTISSTWGNNTLSDIAAGLSSCVLKDGTQTITANIPMATFKLTGLGAASTSGDSVRYEDVIGVLNAPSGTVMLFQQTSAPTGWTKLVTNNDAALRVVSGTASTGGSVAFSTAFSAANTVDGHALSVAEMPAHNHTASVTDPGHRHWPVGSDNFIHVPDFSTAGSAALGSGGQLDRTLQPAATGISVTIANNGSGAAHSHTLTNLAVKYVDVIAASKN